MKRASRACTVVGVMRPRLIAGRPSPTAIDVVVAIVACVAAELELALSSHIQGPAWVNAIAAAGATLPIAFRRRWPLAAAITVAAVVAGQEALGGDLTENSITPLLSFPMVVYAVSAYCDRRRAFAGLTAVLALVWVEVLLSDEAMGGDFLFTALLVFGPWLVGRIVATRVELAG